MIKSISPITLLALLFFAAECGQNPGPKTDQQLTPPPVSPSPQEQAMAEMEKNWRAPFEIQVDSAIFNHHHMGVYTSDQYNNAAITVVVVPAESFAAEKKRFLEKKSVEGEKFKGVVTIGGREMLLRKSVNTEEGLTLALRQYLVDGGNGQVMVLTTGCKPENEAALDKTFEAAVQSLRAKQ